MPLIVVTGRDGQISPKSREHAEEKIAKLSKYFDGIEKIEVILGHTGDLASVELVISVRRGKPIVCRTEAKELHAAVDLVLDKGEVLLTKFKEKLKAHRAGGEKTPGAATGAPGEDEGLESYDEVIEKRDF